MSDALDMLAPFVAALALDADGTIRLAGESVGRLAGPREDRPALATALAPIVYEHGYARAFPAAAADSSDPEDFTAALARANAGRACDEAGWRAAGLDAGGGVTATRHGHTRRFAPGQFVAADGEFPIKPGAPLTVHIPVGSKVAQPGFYYCFGEASREINDLSPTVRFYWNVTRAGAERLVRTLTALLNRYRVPFEFKIAVRSQDYVRRDNAVLYIAQDLFPAVITLLTAAWPALAGLLDDDVPLFAKCVAPGLGFAEDPGNGESFGMARSRLVASALAAAHEDQGFAPTRFEAELASGIEEAGLRLDALWRNPGADDIYVFPSLTPERAAA